MGFGVEGKGKGGGYRKLLPWGEVKGGGGVGGGSEKYSAKFTNYFREKLNFAETAHFWRKQQYISAKKTQNILHVNPRVIRVGLVKGDIYTPDKGH